MKKLLAGMVVVVMLICGSGFVADVVADEIGVLKEENAELRSRVEKLEAALADIQKMLSQQAPAAVVAPAVSSAGKYAIHTKYPVDLYGFIKLDAAYDSSRTNDGNYARWVESENTNKNDEQFNMTARQSRFGLNFNGPDVIGGTQTSGKVEVDFYAGTTENKNEIMMRHAYVQVDWPDSDFSLLAGQTSDVFSPLVAGTVNYAAGWWVGNPGYRRPQLRLTKGFNIKSDSKLLLQGALARTIGDANTFGPGDTGEDAGYPSVQGRVAYSFPLMAEKKTTVGVSGHFGTEEYDTDNTGNSVDYQTWSANLDLTLPIIDKITLKGEAWMGENMDSYLAGIGQGVNTTLLTEIESSGGWAALSIGPFDKLQYNVGAGVDNPEEGDLNTGDRSKNASIFGNVWYELNDAVRMGLELSHWKTDYKDQSNGESFRVQSSVIYNF